jgi:hypothetical protein
MTTTLLQPGQIEAAAGSIPELRLPPADLFLMRARRLEQLAEGHAMADYLRFVARLARAQQERLDAGPMAVLPSAERLAQCREYRMPPLAPAGLARPSGWHDTARYLARTVQPLLTAAGQAALQRVVEGQDALLDEQAARLLDNDTQHLDARCPGSALPCRSLTIRPPVRSCPGVTSSIPNPAPGVRLASGQPAVRIAALKTACATCTACAVRMARGAPSAATATTPAALPTITWRAAIGSWTPKTVRSARPI